MYDTTRFRSHCWPMWMLPVLLMIACIMLDGVAVQKLLGGEQDKSLTNNSSQQWQALSREVAQLTESPPDLAARQRLIAIDDELSREYGRQVSNLRSKILQSLAESEDSAALQYIRGVFENQVEARDEAAHALSLAAYRSPKDLQDWRFLIRSLDVVEAEQAVAVMKALTRFRPRATNAHWIRRVILLAADLPADQQDVALELLGHWTAVAQTDPEAHAKADLAFYRDWFERKWPDEHPAVWPPANDQLKWTYSGLRQQLDHVVFTAQEVAAGRAVYGKANCAKCHVKGDLGQPLGPELSNIGLSRQRKQLLEAIIYPSLELHEDYPSVTVVTSSGKVYTGLMSAGSTGQVKLTDANGTSVQIKQADIEQITPSKVSNMPAGGLESLSLDEIKALFAFLETPENPGQQFHRQPE